MAATAQGVRYTIQLEAAPTLAEAEARVAELKTKDVFAYIVKSQVPGKGTFYRVRVGLYPTMPAARQAGADLQRRGVVPQFYVAPYEKPTAPLAAANSTKPASPIASMVAPPVRETPKPTPTPAPRPNTVTPTPNTQAATSPVASPKANNATPEPDKPRSAPAPVVGGVAPRTTPATTPPAAGFKRFTDTTFGYSLDYPSHWTGQPLNAREAADQRVTAGALFKSNEDAAFLNAIWNKLDNINSLDNNNDLIVEVILKSMASGEGTQLKEVGRRVVTEQGMVKTFLDLQATFQSPGQSSASSVGMEFLGKAVIARTSKGILLVVAFYSKDAPPKSAALADQVIASVRAPQ